MMTGGRGAERTVPVHIINFNFNFLPLTQLFTCSEKCLHREKVCEGRGLPVISQQLKDRQIMIQNTRLGPFKNLSYPDVLLTIFVQK